MLTACMARILVGGASWGRDASDEVLCVGKKSDAFEAFLGLRGRVKKQDHTTV